MQFEMDTRELKKLSRFYKEAPRHFLSASANVLNTLAFQTRKNDIQNITANMIVRNRKFVEDSLVVKKANPIRLEQQIAIAASINRPRFTGWAEQEKGTPMPAYNSSAPRKRLPTMGARGFNKRNIIRPNMRINNYKKFVKLSQFNNNFNFMMRVMGSRGGGYLLIEQDVSVKKGIMPAGIYRFETYKRATKKREANPGRLHRIQKFKFMNPPKRFQWRTQSINQLKYLNIQKVWAESIARTVNKYR